MVARRARATAPVALDLEDERMLRVLAENEQLYRLEDADGTMIGWIRESTIGFRGRDDERRALMGAAAAWRSLEAVLHRAYAGWPRYEPAIGQLHVLHDGQQEWIADATRRLARLLRFNDAPPGAKALALEFDLPSYVPLGTIVSAAESMSRALAEAWPTASRPASATSVLRAVGP
jgi:hypothetical protein